MITKINTSNKLPKHSKVYFNGAKFLISLYVILAGEFKALQDVNF